MNTIKTDRFNTNNAWGFGGGTGTEITYDNGLVCRKGTAHFRHAPSQSFNNWYINYQDDRLSIQAKPKERVDIYYSEEHDRHLTVVDKDHGDVAEFPMYAGSETNIAYKRVHSLKLSQS